VARVLQPVETPPRTMPNSNIGEYVVENNLRGEQSFMEFHLCLESVWKGMELSWLGDS